MEMTLESFLSSATICSLLDSPSSRIELVLVKTLLLNTATSSPVGVVVVGEGVVAAGVVVGVVIGVVIGVAFVGAVVVGGVILGGVAILVTLQLPV